MFKRVSDDPESVAVGIFFDDEPIAARAGDSVAAALLSAGVTHLRTTPVTGAPRAPYCMMGVCFDCLVNIDGQGNCQACLVTVSEGMRITRQIGKREAGQ